MLVSVIVPVYNAEKYLKECLDSLVNQTLEELEVVAVNNGSSDASLKILESYKKAYPQRIVVCNLEEADVSTARNEGISLARGEYIGFVDSDDYVDKDMYKLLYEKAMQKPEGFDVAACDLMVFFENSDKRQVLSSNITADIHSEDGVRAAFVDSYAVITNKIFRRSLFDSGVRFVPKIWSEDIEFLYRIFPEIKSIGVIFKPLYYYRQRIGSLTHIFNDRLYDYVTNFEAIIKDYRLRGYYAAYEKELEYQFVRYVYATMVKRLAKCGDKKVFDTGVAFAKESVKKNFPAYRKNPIFYKNGLKGIYLVLFNSFLARLVFIKEQGKKYNN